LLALLKQNLGKRGRGGGKNTILVFSLSKSDCASREANGKKRGRGEGGRVFIALYFTCCGRQGIVVWRGGGEGRGKKIFPFCARSKNPYVVHFAILFPTLAYSMWQVNWKGVEGGGEGGGLFLHSAFRKKTEEKGGRWNLTSFLLHRRSVDTVGGKKGKGEERGTLPRCPI